MKRLNLLPESRYTQQRRRRGRVRVIALSGAVLMLVIGWIAFARTQLAQLDYEISVSRREASRLARADHDAELIADQLQSLTLDIEALESIPGPIAPSSLLAMLSRRLPGDVALRRLELEIPEPRVMSAAGPLPPIRLHLIGLASNPLAATQLVTTLSEEPALRNIRLAGSQTNAAESGVHDQFSLSLDIPLVHRRLVVHHEEQLP